MGKQESLLVARTRWPEDGSLLAAIAAWGGRRVLVFCIRRWMLRVVISLLVVSVAQAVPVMTPTGGTFSGTSVTSTRGWEFTTNANLQVNALGFYDQGSDGLGQEHEVGIFSNLGSLLVSGIVPAGTAGTLIGDFRYVSIAPIILAAGQTFRIGAFFEAGQPDLHFFSATANPNPAITYLGTRFILAATFADPTNVRNDLNDGFFGPNFDFVLASSTAVPEISDQFATPLACTFLMFCLSASRRKTLVT